MMDEIADRLEREVPDPSPAEEAAADREWYLSMQAEREAQREAQRRAYEQSERDQWDYEFYAERDLLAQ